jgi:phosphate-selective porin OprO/OprP
MVLNNFIKVACLSTCLGLASGSILANANYNIDTNGGLKVYDTSNNDHWFHLSGKIQFDNTLYHMTQDNSLQRSVDLSAVEADLKGGIGQNTSYQVRFNRTADGSLQVNKAQVNYSGFNEWSRVSIGHIGMPYGLEKSNTGSSFLERSLSTSMFAPKSGFGVGVDAWTDKVGLRLAVTQPSNEKADRLGASFRFSCAPYNTDNLIFHLGLSGQHHDGNVYFLGNGEAFNANFRTSGEVNARNVQDAERTLESGKNKVTSYNVISADAAVLRGPLFLQGEYHRAAMNMASDEVEAVSAQGWNVQASYAITGESRDYNYQKGSFSNIRTERDSGSWEVSLRHSFVKLQKGDRDGGSANTLGGSVSWVANNNVTVLANYIHTPVAQPKSLNGEGENQNSAGALALRLQAAW